MKRYSPHPALRATLSQGRGLFESLLRYHDAVALKPDLESAVLAAFDHHVLQRLVVHDGGNQVSGPGNECRGRDRKRQIARDPKSQRLNCRGDRQRALTENLHGVDLALVGAVVNRLDAIGQRLLERQQIASLDVDELFAQIEKKRLPPFLVDEDLALANSLDQRLRRGAEEA